VRCRTLFPIELTPGVIPNTGQWGDHVILTSASDCDWEDVDRPGFCVGVSGDLELLLALDSDRCGFKADEFLYECIGAPGHDGPHFACEVEKLHKVPLVIISMRNRYGADTKIS